MLARRSSGLRVGLVFAGLMVAIPLAAKLANRFGWAETGDFAERSLLALIGAFIMTTGNTIPKRLVPRACLDAGAAEVQGFLRLAGWTWVLAGLAFALACLFLPRDAATTATFVIMPAAILLVLIAWLRLRASVTPAR